MSKSLLQTANTSEQTVVNGGVVDPGVIIRRYGPNCNLNGSPQKLSNIAVPHSFFSMNQNRQT